MFVFYTCAAVFVVLAPWAQPEEGKHEDHPPETHEELGRNPGRCRGAASTGADGSSWQLVAGRSRSGRTRAHWLEGLHGATHPGRDVRAAPRERRHHDREATQPRRYAGCSGGAPRRRDRSLSGVHRHRSDCRPRHPDRVRYGRHADRWRGYTRRARPGASTSRSTTSSPRSIWSSSISSGSTSRPSTIPRRSP